MRTTEELLARNEEQSSEYTSVDATSARQVYRARHQTAISATKCSDGRLNLARICQVPPGIIQPWRNIGAEFNIGWPTFNLLLQDWVDYNAEKGRNRLFINSYHWSCSRRELGCLGAGYDRERAMRSAANLCDSLLDIYGRTVSYAITVGIETDLESLLLHGSEGHHLSLAFDGITNTNELNNQLTHVYPDMPVEIRTDLAALLMGNLAHVAANRAANRPVEDLEHQENILAIGRGFDWLHMYNRALIIGPFHCPDLTEPIIKGAKIIAQNMRAGRIDPNDGILVIASTPTYVDEPQKVMLAKHKSRYLHQLTVKCIQEHVPELMPHLDHLVGVTDMRSRRFHIDIP